VSIVTGTLGAATPRLGTTGLANQQLTRRYIFVGEALWTVSVVVPKSICRFFVLVSMSTLKNYNHFSYTRYQHSCLLKYNPSAYVDSIQFCCKNKRNHRHFFTAFKSRESCRCLTVVKTLKSHISLFLVKMPLCWSDFVQPVQHVTSSKAISSPNKLVDVKQRC